jgi:hypothetical protein
MSVEREYEGKSSDGNLQNALSEALQQLSVDLGEGGVCDASASWVIAEIAGQYGGLPGFHNVNVKIAAKRTPEWPSN